MELAAEVKDSQWSSPLEPQIIDTVRSLDDGRIALLAVECRTSTCGIFVNLVVSQPANDPRAESKRVSDEVSASVRSALARLGLDAFASRTRFEFGEDGSVVGRFEFMGSDSSRRITPLPPQRSPWRVEELLETRGVRN